MDLGVIVGIVGALAGIVAIPITFIVARRTRQRPDLRYSIDFDVLLRPSDRLFDEGLYMTLGDRKISCISRTRIAFWNQRGDTVNGTEALKSDPIRLQFLGDDHPLQARIISLSRKQIALAGKLDPKFDSCAVIGFDFLDAGDGGIIEVIHQGTEKPKVLGTVRGATISQRGSVDLGPDALSKIAETSVPRRLSKNVKRNKSTWALMSTAGILMAAIIFIVASPFLQNPGPLINASKFNLRTLRGQVNFVNEVNSTTYYDQATGHTFLILIIILVLIALLLVSVPLFRNMKRRVPAGIVAYKEPTTTQHAFSSASQTDNDAR